MQAISAPYNFVPLATWVHIPEWGRRASHDMPWHDGYSGEIHYRLHAHSPLLVGGPASEHSPGEVRPYLLPDGRYAIPGSSLKGMLRAVVEIAGFGRMRMVDDVRPGLRDITGRFVKESYTSKVRNRMRAGLLRQRADGGQEIVPCLMARLDHRDLELFLSIDAPIFPQGKTVHEKYEIWSNACTKKDVDPAVLHFELPDGDAKPCLRARLSGVPVFTGQISDSTKRNGKRRDFVFYAPDPSRSIDVAESVWCDFLAIHGDQEQGGQAHGMSWPGHWKRIYREGRDVPVFYVQDGDLLRIGLAYMPKLAGDFSVHDLIRHSAKEHLEAPGVEQGYDLADLLFGAIGERQDDALRGRVSCETAVADGMPALERQADTILNGPKPTYFPNYLLQETDSTTQRLASEQYSTYVGHQGNRRPILRGHKRYPARPEAMTHVQHLTDEQRTNRKVQVRLHTLKEGATFSGRILFHNLRPEELGALLWAITWGDDDSFRHGLGMGKPFGFGQVTFTLDPEKSRLVPNDPDHLPESMMARRSELMKGFQDHMETAARGQGGWAASLQVRNLLAMANPMAAGELPAGMELRHMLLMRCQRDGSRENLNEFQWAKQQPPGPFVLADYDATVTVGPPTPPGDQFHRWLRQAVSELMKANNAPEGDILRGKALAERWRGIEDPETKDAVLASIREYWQQQGWWDSPPGRSAKRAKAVYAQEA